LTVKEGFLSIVQKINPHTELSKAVMETLAVIAWKQPITQAKVVDIRTNKAYDHVEELVELGFITKERYGRSYMLRITQKFLDYFDLPDQEAARKLFMDFRDEDLQKKMSEFKKKEGKDKGEGKEETGEEQPHAQLGQLDVYDIPPEENTVSSPEAPTEENKLGDLDVFEEPEEAETLEEETEEGMAVTGKTRTSAEETEEPRESEEEPEDESERAKMIARQLLEEDQPIKEEKEEELFEERNLHPVLEEYLKGEAEEKEKPRESEEPEENETGEEPQEPPRKTEKNKKSKRRGPEEDREEMSEEPEEEDQEDQ
ncbi:MAG: SMC-Scp complex subunit ScpB, partial [Nanoarchaeota archaeon]|nr:SMC-Scp complex subunit ScpB [Nanoarchaeota archaeon]